MKPIITFTDEGYSEGFSTVLRRLEGLTFEVTFRTPTDEQTVLYESNMLVAELVSVDEDKLLAIFQRHGSAMQHLIPFEEITMLEYQ